MLDRPQRMGELPLMSQNQPHPVHNLLGTALIGTARQSIPTPDADTSPLDQLLTAVTKNKNSDKQAHHLLIQVGTRALHQQLGQTQTQQLPPPASNIAPDPHQQPMPQTAVHLLQDLCDSSELNLIQALLDHAVGQNWHIPSQLLPKLLTLGRKNGRLRPHITQALDNVGRWLARQQDDWHYALWPEQNRDELAQQFSQGSSSERLPLLRWIRNQDPAHGLRLLQNRWQTMPDSTRPQLLQLLHEQRSTADAPFLERCLDDRHILTRRKAQELLACLPESDYAQRMIAHGRMFMRWQPRHKTPLIVTPPDKHTPSMQRDGIAAQTERQQNSYLGKRLTTLVGATPLDYWIDPANNIGIDMPHFLELVARSSWTRTLITGLVTASKRQQRPDWAHALINWAAGGHYEKLTLRNTHLLTPEQFATLVHHAYEERNLSDPLKTNGRLAHLLRAWKRPWPQESAELILSCIQQHLKQQHPEKAPDASTKTAVRQFFSQLPTELATHATAEMAQLKGLHPQWKTTIDRGLKTCRFRQRLAQLARQKL